MSFCLGACFIPQVRSDSNLPLNSLPSCCGLVVALSSFLIFLEYGIYILIGSLSKQCERKAGFNHTLPRAGPESQGELYLQVLGAHRPTWSPRADLDLTGWYKHHGHTVEGVLCLLHTTNIYNQQKMTKACSKEPIYLRRQLF